LTEQLRYTGSQAATFQAPGVGHVEPQGEFDVDPSLLLSFMRRRDIEHAEKCPVPPCRCGAEPAPELPAVQAPEGGITVKPKGRRDAQD
jgi:hypothetical protein